MSLLIATIPVRPQILAVQRMLEVYFIINQLKYNSDDLTVLSYYCLYGVSKRTNLRIQEEHYYPRDRSEQSAVHAIHNIRYKLKKLGVLIQDVYTLELYLNEDLNRMFEDKTKLGCMLNFSFDEPATADLPEPGENQLIRE